MTKKQGQITNPFVEAIREWEGLTVDQRLWLISLLGKLGKEEQQTAAGVALEALMGSNPNREPDDETIETFIAWVEREVLGEIEDELRPTDELMQLIAEARFIRESDREMLRRKALAIKDLGQQRRAVTVLTRALEGDKVVRRDEVRDIAAQFDILAGRDPALRRHMAWEALDEKAGLGKFLLNSVGWALFWPYRLGRMLSVFPFAQIVGLGINLFWLAAPIFIFLRYWYAFVVIGICAGLAFYVWNKKRNSTEEEWAEWVDQWHLRWLSLIAEHPLEHEYLPTLEVELEELRHRYGELMNDRAFADIRAIGTSSGWQEVFASLDMIRYPLHPALPEKDERVGEMKAAIWAYGLLAALWNYARSRLPENVEGAEILEEAKSILRDEIELPEEGDEEGLAQLVKELREKAKSRSSTY